MYFSNLNYTFTIDTTHFEISTVSSGIFKDSVPRHRHSLESYEFHIVTGGKGMVTIDDSSYTLSENAVYITGPSVPHEQIPDMNDPMSEHCFYCRIHSSHNINDSVDADTSSLSALYKNHSFHMNRHHTKLRILSDWIISELECKPHDYNILVTSLFQILVIEFSRLFREEKGQSAVANTSMSETQMLSIIESQFMQLYKTITLTSLSQTINLSQRQTERIMRKYYDTSFVKKRMEARIYASTHLLATTDLSLTDIADAVGYSTVNHFAESFKKIMRTSPGKYRKSL